MQAECTVQIPLRARDGSLRAYLTVDAADAEAVNKWVWRLNSNGYAVRNSGTILVHRELLGLIPGDDMEVDHIDRNRLNCSRANMRVVTPAQNMQNMPSHRDSSSVYRGVHWSKRRNKWTAQVRVNGHGYHLGMFTNEIDAARAAADARRELLPYSVEHPLTTVIT